ncbi:MAG: DUF6188 family protein [Candidatus Obscuribacterales bacterium]
MHKLPKDCDLSFLEDVPLDTIDFGVNDIHFWFHNGAKLTVEYRFHLRQMHGEETSWRSGMLIDPESSGLLRLIQQKINRIDVHHDQDLDLRFGNGAGLLVVGTDNKYECYRITYGDTQIVV